MAPETAGPANSGTSGTEIRVVQPLSYINDTYIWNIRGINHVFSAKSIYISDVFLVESEILQDKSRYSL